jgi:uncharacterized protein with ATP-grasp and redox domains
MKTHLECIPCFIKQSLEASRMVQNDEKKHELVIKEVMNYLVNTSLDISPPELSKEVHKIIRNVTKSEDPYKKVKKISNEKGKNLYKKIKNIVENSNDNLLTAIKYSIIGNSIDFGTFKRYDIDKIIDNDIRQNFINLAYEDFKKSLKNSDIILYLADNTGEIFFDKILIEELLKKRKKIYYAVKANPIINDALKEDAEYAGLDKITDIIEYDNEHLDSSPGVVIKNASTNFIKIFNSVDMVISKGQGNYESLNNVSREIFFLLMVKCPIVANDIEVPEGSLLFKVNK